MSLPPSIPQAAGTVRSPAAGQTFSLDQSGRKALHLTAQSGHFDELDGCPSFKEGHVGETPEARLRKYGISDS